MQTFLQYISEQLIENNISEQEKIIFPNKRSASLCKNAYVAKMSNTAFLPEFITIEDLICELSGLDIDDPIALKFKLCEHYQAIFPDKETTDQVFSWADQLIADFSEMDRNLIDEKEMLGYLKAIKEIEHWSKTDQPTDMVRDYLDFWNKLPELYDSYTKELLDHGKVYQGLAYRKAVEHLSDHVDEIEDAIYFVGFNALNQAEEALFQILLENNKGQAFWDVDAYYLENKHSASYFIRQYQQQWKVLQNKQHKIHPSTRSFSNDKIFSVYSCQGNVQQAKSVGEIVDQLDDVEVKETAILLGDESVLESLMFSIPKRVENINITMGLPLHKTSVGAFFINYIKLCKAEQPRLFHKDILQLLESSFLWHMFPKDLRTVKEHLEKEQYFFLDENELRAVSKSVSSEFREIFLQLFTEIPDDTAQLDYKLQQLTVALLSRVDDMFLATLLDKVTLVCESIREHLEGHHPELSLNGYLNLFREMIGQEQVDLRGEKDSGLQIMGLLESRCLDFKNIIITSVNEGVLPQGKTASSFIPFDLKKHYGLPTYQEKDKVYSYHFFRILQRASNIHLLYNQQSSKLSFAEESRFIKILEEYQLDQHQFHRYNVKVDVEPKRRPEKVQKNPEIQASLKYWMTQKGVSASALNTYIRDPYSFYQKYVLGVKEEKTSNDLESADIFGTVVHNILDKLYSQLPIGQKITPDHIRYLRSIKNQFINDSILEECGNNAFDKGSNLLGFEAINKQIALFLNEELDLVDNNDLQLLGVEDDDSTCELRTDMFDQPIKLYGKIDRLDQLNGTKRIIDYKTGASKKLNVNDPGTLIMDEKNSHAFQTLFYSLLKQENFDATENWQAGNIYLKEKDKSFKALKINGENILCNDIVEQFKTVLLQLLKEIYSLEVPFDTKEAHL